MEISDDLAVLITNSKNVRDIKTLLPPKSKRTRILRTLVILSTSFLPASTHIRERLWYIEHNTHTAPTCRNCNNHVRWNIDRQCFRIFCSSKCVATNVEAATKKIQTNLVRLGVAFPAQDSKVRHKYRQTMLQRYGTCYTNQQHIPLNVRNNLNSKEWLENEYNALKKSTFRIAEEQGVSQAIISKRLSKYNIIGIRHLNSQIERDVVQLLQSNSVNDIVQNSRRVLSNKQELDIFIPSLNIAIEINGVFWHSELNGKNRQYHLTKTHLCQQQNIRLVHIFDTEWEHNNDIVKSRLCNIAGTNKQIFARKCEIEMLSTSDSKQFLLNNHIQGYIPCSLNVALIYEDNIVMVMSFGPSRYNKNVQYELIRFASLNYTSVVGGASRLFKFFVTQYSPNSIVSYSDVRWNTGRIYENVGFQLSRRSKPNYFYFKPPNNILFSRIQFQKHKLEDKLPIFDPQLTEWENMVNNGYDRIWDCGNDVWIWS